MSDQEAKIRKATDKMVRARGHMVIKLPYFATLAMSLRLHFSTKIPKAYTDGVLLVVNPDYVNEMNDNDVRLLWAEAALKCGLKLPFRMGYRDTKLWNQAATIVAGQYLQSTFSLPREYPQRGDCTDKNCEEVYGILLAEQCKGNNGGGNNSSRKSPGGQSGGQQGGGSDQGDGTGNCDSGGKCDVSSTNDKQSKDDRDEYTDEHDGDRPEPDGNRNVTPEEMQANWDPINRNAMNIAKNIGDVPAWMSKMMESNRHAQIDWRAKLREYVELTCRDDYSWVKFNKRHIVNGIYLPSLYSESLPTIGVLGDVSGSVQDYEWDYFLAELNKILEDFKAEVHLYQFDSEPKGDADIYTHDDLPLKVTRKGCGGTDPCSTFRKLDKDDIDPVCIIVFSDLEICDYPKTPPDVPVLWVSSQKLSKVPTRYLPPFGEVCQLTLD